MPQGASLKIDGTDAGTTLKIAQLAVGKHILEFNKEGFNAGTFPVEIGPDDASGGSVSYELGTSVHDTVELRDGTVLSGDLLSVDATDITIRVGGTAQHFGRNQVKRILLVERDPPVNRLLVVLCRVHAVSLERTFELDVTSSARTSQSRRIGRSISLRSVEPRFDRQLGIILDHATEVFCEKGYEGASMRDIARATGMSLAGMYHYLGSKERLLYLIQRHTFSTILTRLRGRLNGVADPEEGIRIFILNHLGYFLEHQQAMKVLSHEDEALQGEYGREIAEIKREYYRICRELLNRYKKEKGLQFDSRTTVLSLFGMMNWLYTWYKPRLDGNADRLAREMSKILFVGISGS